MNRIMQRTMNAVMLGVTLLTTPTVFAFYNPSTGRFLSRDPVDEPGFQLVQGPQRAPRVGPALVAQQPTRWIDRDSPDAPGIENTELPLKTVDAAHAPYRFVDNNSISLVDALGLDIYLQTGNNSGNPINDRVHQQICVDTWSGTFTCCGNKTGKRCFSFGANGQWRIPVPSTKWLFWNEFNAGGPLVGEIYETDHSGGKVVGTITTTCKQDFRWLTYVLATVGAKDTYSVARHNCRRYSQYEFRDAPFHMGAP